MGKFLYIVYEWTNRTIKVISCNRDKAYAKVGEDFLAGENIDDYHVIEVNLEDENLLQEMKEIMSMVVETKGFMESCRFEKEKEIENEKLLEIIAYGTDVKSITIHKLCVCITRLGTISRYKNRN